MILLSVGSAVFWTTFISKGIAEDALQETLAKSQQVHSTYQQQHLSQLGLIARIVAGDPYLKAYIAQAVEAVDVASILDLLEEQQSDLGFDFAIVLDPDGVVVARTDDPRATGRDLSEQPHIATALEEYQAFGVWKEGEQLFNAVVVPLEQNFDLIGFLATGYVIGDDMARQLKDFSSVDIAFLTTTPSGAEVIASTRQLDGQLVRSLRTQGSLHELLSQGTLFEVDLDGEDWIGRSAPLMDSQGNMVGATVSLASRQKALGTYRDIERLLLLVGALSMLGAFALSFAISKRTMKPVTDLARAASAAKEGRYDQRIDVDRSDEVGQLAAAFEALLSELRERRDMQEYIKSLSRNLPEPGGGGRASLSPPELTPVALMGIELRRYANPRMSRDPEHTLERLTKDLRRVSSCVSAHRGHIESIAGHRIVASFEGEDRSFRALQAATRAATQLSTRESAFHEVEPPAAAVVSGEAVNGGVVWAESPEQVMVGLPVQQLDSLLREAAPGDILLSKDMHDELGETFRQAGYELSLQRGLMSSQPMYNVKAEVAAKVAGAQGETLAVPEAQTPALEGTGEPTLSEIGPGTLLGERYEVLGLLGAGGMGVVYKARDRALDDLVALKMLKPDVWNNPVELERLKSELKLARKITHPNVLRTFDFGELDGIPFISMEYVRGLTLRYLLDHTGRLPFSAALRLAKQLCAGLAVAHAEGILHRDIKPENLILEQTGNVKLMDFGIARPVRSLQEAKTEAGMIMGTPHYMAPEQLEGKEADERADIYACGVVFYEIFSGKLPFSAANPVEIMMQHLKSAPAPPSQHWPNMPPRLEHLIMRCLEKDRERRFATVIELHEELESVAA